MPSEKRELRMYWSKKEDNLMIWSTTRPDGHLTHQAMSSNPVGQPSILRPNDPPDLPFTKELERRGYDLTTLKFRVQRRDNHPWVKRGALVYPQRGGLPSRVDWIRWRGAAVTVFFAPTERDVGCAPITQCSFDQGKYGLALAEVERDFQPSPIVQPDWTPDELPPLWPPSPPRKP